MKKDIIRAILKEPGQEPKFICIANTLEAFQETVGGYIEGYPIQGTDAFIICDEEGKLKDKKFNFYLIREIEMLVGTVLVVGVDDDGDYFVDCPIGLRDFIGRTRDDIGAYYCNRCDSWFDEPSTATVCMEDLFGVGGMFPNHNYEKMFCCPFCGDGDIVTKGEFFR